MARGKSWDFSLTKVSFQSHTRAVRIILWMAKARQAAFLFTFCFTNNTEVTNHLFSLLQLKTENMGRRGRPEVLVLGNDQGLELCSPELSSELGKN